MFYFSEKEKSTPRPREEKKYKTKEFFAKLDKGEIIEHQLMKKDVFKNTSWLNKVMNMFYEKSATGEWEKIKGWYKCTLCDDYYKYIEQNADGNWDLRNHVKSKHRSIFDAKDELQYDLSNQITRFR